MVYLSYLWTELTIHFTETIFTVTEGDAATVCAEVIGGRIDRGVIIDIDALPNRPNGGNATCMYSIIPCVFRVYHRCVIVAIAFFSAESVDQDYLAITNIRTFYPLPGQAIADPVCASFTTIDENAEFQTVIVEDVEFFEVTLTSSDSAIIVPDASLANVLIIDNDRKFTHYLYLTCM